MSYSRYKKQIYQVSFDDGLTWKNVTDESGEYIYRKGALIASDLAQCYENVTYVFSASTVESTKYRKEYNITSTASIDGASPTNVDYYVESKEPWMNASIDGSSLVVTLNKNETTSDRSGQLILKQSESGKVISITYTQKVTLLTRWKQLDILEDYFCETSDFAFNEYATENELESDKYVKFVWLNGEEEIIYTNSSTANSMTNQSMLGILNANEDKPYKIIFGSGITDIKGFSGSTQMSQIEEVVIGSGATSIGYCVFYGGSALKTITSYSNDCKWTAQSESYLISSSGGTLYIPNGTYNTYTQGLFTPTNYPWGILERTFNWEIYDIVGSEGFTKFYKEILEYTTDGGETWNTYYDTDGQPIYRKGGVYLTNLEKCTQTKPMYRWVQDVLVCAPINYITYTSMDGEIVTPSVTKFGDATVESNIYEDGKGKLYFDTYPQLIPSNAFKGCETLASIELIDTITSIGSNAFSGCTSLTNVAIGDGVTSIGDYVFMYCSNLTSIEIPNSVTSIGQYAFYYSSKLASITIPNSVTTIGRYAFSHCTNLTSIEIPNSVTSIEYQTFGFCKSLSSITIPNSVTSIGQCTFQNCSNLTSVTYNGTIAQWNTIPKGFNWKLYVPTSCIVHCTDGDINI